MSHNHSSDKHKCKLVAMITLNFSFFLVELIVGYICQSMALVADSFHMLSDVAALVVAYFAVKMSQKSWEKNTYGWARAEVLGALVNSVFLIALCFSIFIESIKRFVQPEEIQRPVLLCVVGSIGLLMNIIGLCIFKEPHSHDHGHSHNSGNNSKRRSTLTHSNRLTRMVQSNVDEDEQNMDDNDIANEDTIASSSNDIIQKPVHQTDENIVKFQSSQKPNSPKENMNIRGVFLHLLADTLGSVIVVISSVVVISNDWEYNKYIDPCLSMCMVILILFSVFPLLIESSLILLQSVPDHIKVDEIKTNLLKQIKGVIGVHELHVWQLTGERLIATAHINCTNLEEYFQIAEKVKAVFHNEGIHSTTIQPEFAQQSTIDGGEDCYLSCSALSTVADCSENTCCPKPTNNNKSGRHP